MDVQLMVQVGEGPVQTLRIRLSESAQEMEEQTCELTQRAGRVILEQGLQHLALASRAPRCCGRAMKDCGRRTHTLTSLFGEMILDRRRYRCRSCGREDYPADAGMCCGEHRITRPLAKRACQLAAIEHYTRLSQLLADQHGVTLCHETIVSLAQQAGGELDRFRQLEAARSARRRDTPPAAVLPPPERICVSCDGIMYCTNQAEDDSQHPGQKRLIWQQMKVGCVAWQDEHKHWHKRVVWGRESPEDFAAALWRLACQCGYRQAKEKLFQADGGGWCWDVQARFFSDATGILDWYHVSEHVWDTAKAVAPGEKASTWAHTALTQLHDGGGTALVAWLEPQLKAARGQRRTALQGLRDYLITKVDRMEYPTYRQRGWPIGSGLIEATCKQLVGVRLKGPGMHWTEHGALAITALRAADLNGHWHQTWNSLLLAT
jgi:hypothetical protein